MKAKKILLIGIFLFFAFLIIGGFGISVIKKNHFFEVFKQKEIKKEGKEIFCKKRPVFTYPPLKFDEFVSIIPLGNVNPSAHVFPTDHLYFVLKKKNPADSESPPRIAFVFSPGDIKITRISRFRHLSAIPPFTDYKISFTFKDCPAFEAYFGHIQSLEGRLKEIENSKEAWDCETYSTGGEKYEYCTKELKIEISSGEKIGKAGREGQISLDFGARDFTSSPLRYINPSRYKETDLYVVCPLDYFTPSLKRKLYEKLGDWEGKRQRKIKPLCGEVCQDIPGTAQGNWFKKGEDSENEDPNLALIHDNIDPTIGVFSIGTSFPNLGPGVYKFAPKNQGFINRDFSEVKPDGHIYCYEINSSKRIILQLLDENSLKIEFQKRRCKENEKWRFTKNAVEFER